ncbi:MAG TPA: hypothetical protein VLR29_02930 [Flavobacterium sp.]|nr:hypothetical protein [Flavobacterium sp.]
MFDISALKEMKLSELQEIAKAAKTIKFNGVKKEALISQILKLQSANTDLSSVNKKAEVNLEEDKPKRARIATPKKAAIQKTSNTSLFAEEETPVAIAPQVVEKEIVEEAIPEITEKKVGKVIKFNKSAYEKKMALQKQKEEAKAIAQDNESAADNEADSETSTSEISENSEVGVPAKKINPNQLHKQNPNQNPNTNPNQNGL